MGAMTGLLLLLWAGVTVGSVLDLQKRIIGGGDCLDGERQYHVKLRTYNGTHRSICGGSLISDQWILTAAHCWKREAGWNMTAYLNRSPEGVVITHHVIYEDKNKEKHDIMLLKLPDGTPIPPVQLPDCKSPLNIGDKVQVAGYGFTAVDSNNVKIWGKRGVPDKLQCGDMTVVDCAPMEACVKNLHSWSSKELWLCHKDNAGIVDTAPGDSGGGVVFKNMIYGVHSNSDPQACVGAAVSMDVCHGEYLEWIYKKTGIPKP